MDLLLGPREALFLMIEVPLYMHMQKMGGGGFARGEVLNERWVYVCTKMLLRDGATQRTVHVNFLSVVGRGIQC